MTETVLPGSNDMQLARGRQRGGLGASLVDKKSLDTGGRNRLCDRFSKTNAVAWRASWMCWREIGKASRIGGRRAIKFPVGSSAPPKTTVCLLNEW